MRRQQFLYLMGLSALPFRLFAADLPLTPSQSEGPFYPVVPIPLRSSLIRDEKNLEGEVLQLDGRVLDRQGDPLAGARIEIWQCDGNGVYAHPAQDGHQHFDPGFEGFGAQLTGHQGGYRFTTLYPVPYPGRPPHIHVKIWQSSQERLTTQLYLRGNLGRGWFKSQREPLQIDPRTEIGGRAKARFTFVV